MTPQEKAKELVDKFQKEVPDYLYQGKMLDIAAKACAVICVDEMLNHIITMDENVFIETSFAIEIKFWRETKQSIIELK